MNNGIKQSVEELLDHLQKREKFNQSQVKIVACPYPITIFGENNNAVGGKSISTALDLYSVLIFFPSNTHEIRLYCKQIPGVFKVYLQNIGAYIKDDWVSFVRGAANELKKRFKIQNGFTGVLSVPFPKSIISMSSVVELLSLMALSNVNKLDLRLSDHVQTCEDIDKNFLKQEFLSLDPVTIKHSKKENLLLVDFGINKLKHLKNSSNSSSYRFFILSDNTQVGSTLKNYDDFIQTAILLGMMSGIGDSKDFSKLTYENFEEHKSKLPMEFQKKAKNYFHQQELLTQCTKAWERNDLNLFGKLIKKSKNENSREIDILCEKINGFSSIYGAKVSNDLQIVGICENKNAEEAIKNLILKQEEIDCRFCSISNGILHY